MTTVKHPKKINGTGLTCKNPRARLQGMLPAALALLLILPCCASRALAQESPDWTVNDASNCWAGFTGNFLYTNSTNGYEWFGGSQGGSDVPGLWQEAEMLEVTEDAMNYAGANFSNSDKQTYIDEINAICSGIGSQFPYQWEKATTNDTAPNDDLCWMAIAYARAYSTTGNTNWLKQAETGFGVVWARAQVGGDAAQNGLTAVQPPSTNVSSAVNYGCVVAAHWLALEDPAQAAFYTNCANSVYTFCVGKGNLYSASNGKVRDSLTGPIDYTYNYGIALQAAVCQGDETTCQKIAQYLANSFVGYGPNAYTNNGTWTDGTNTYSVLPYYGNPNEPRWKNDAGYDGVCFRGLGYAFAAGYLTTWQKQWARENVEAAFHYRNTATQLMWGNWQAPTPASNPYPYLYSWDCSCAVSGILNIPGSVIGPLPRPVINRVSLGGSNLFMSGTNGYAGSGYYLLTSTNICLPLSSWTKAQTNSFAAGGVFSITNPMLPGAPSEFFAIRLQ